MKLKKVLLIAILVLGVGTKITHAQTIQEYVIQQAKKVGVNPKIAVWIVQHESQFNPKTTGDDGQSRGLWQISKKWHPEVSDKCAYDIKCSTNWSLKQILHGKIQEWSTWKYCRKWFKDCLL